MPKRPGTVENGNNDHPTKKANAGHWSAGLLKSMEDPALIVKTDDLVTVIKDAYPKAEFHYLILPKQNISNLKQVEKKNLELLKHMDKIARDLITDDKHKNKQFSIGYHAEPSMARLHLHVISDDMNSLCLKTKKHWNSFTTDFFIKSKIVMDSLDKNGKITLLSADECKKLMNFPLKCHKCDYLPKNIPDLKKHIVTHL